MKIEKRDIITAIAFVALFAFLGGCEKIKSLAGADVVEKETTTTTEYATKKKVDSVLDLVVSNQNSEPQRIVVSQGKIKPVAPNYELKEPEKEKGAEIKEVKKYLDTTYFSNGILFSEIYADNIYGKNFTLTTTDTVKTITKRIKEKVVMSNWFYGAGMTMGLNKGIKTIEGTVSYVHKDKFILGTGIQYNLDYDPVLQSISGFGLKLNVAFNFK